MKRAYRQGRRAEATAQTRERILRATLALWHEVGPRGATVAEVARRAGVDRLTVYNHLPDDAAQAGAAWTLWLGEHPWPDLLALVAEEDPEERLRQALLALWGWYGATRVVTGAVLRDGPAMPGLAPALLALREGLAGAAAILAIGRRRTAALAPTLEVALEFRTWEVLAALPPATAAAAVEGWVRAAEDPDSLRGTEPSPGSGRPGRR